MNLLLDREYKIDGNWYKALDKLRGYKSVERADFWNTCSSAGDWDGYIVQRVKDRRYLIFFTQENNYPRFGFTVWTDNKPVASWEGELTRDQVLSIVDDIVTDMWNR